MNGFIKFGLCSVVLVASLSVYAKPNSKFLIVGKPLGTSGFDQVTYIENLLERTRGRIDYETPSFWRVEVSADSEVLKAAQFSSIEADAPSYVEVDELIYPDSEGERVTVAADLPQASSSTRSLGLPSPNDPRFSNQYYLSNSGQSGGRAGIDISWLDVIVPAPPQREVLVAICDDGIDIDHPDMVTRVYRNPGEIPADGIDNDGNGFIDDVSGWDFNSNDADPRPDVDPESGLPHHHGTMTSGLVVAEANNGIGIAGVAPNARLLPMKIDGNGGPAWKSSLVRAIDYAIARGARVISVSYNIDTLTESLIAAVGRAQANDVIYVNSAGNGARNVDAFRGQLRRQYSNVLLVGSIDRNGNMGRTSSFGTTVDIVAPGVDVLSLLPRGRYGQNTGTSFAAPIAAGAIAILRSLYPTETHQQILSRLIMGSERLPNITVPLGGGLVRLARSASLP